MAGNNAAILHEGGTTSTIATYCYMMGNALGTISDHVYVFKGGWKYLMGDDNIHKGDHYLDFQDVNIDFRGRKNPMGSDRACPVPIPKKSDTDYTDRIIERLKRLGISKVAHKGGDDGAFISNCLMEPFRQAGISIVHIPKTIDVDLYTGTQFGQFLVSDTPGVRSAIKNIGEDPTMEGLKYEAQDTGRVFALEIMGRKCGELALAVAYKIGADYCIIPEMPMTNERIDRLMGKIKPGNVVVVSEGATWWDADENKCTGFYVYRQDGHGNMVPIEDTHGRKKLGKAGEGVATAIEKSTGITARDQVTGYMGRSGPPCAGDIEYETVLAWNAARLFSEGKTGVMPAPSRVVPYTHMKGVMYEFILADQPNDYGKFKKRMVQPFNTDAFFDAENFRWKPKFGELVDTMLAASEDEIMVTI